MVEALEFGLTSWWQLQVETDSGSEAGRGWGSLKRISKKTVTMGVNAKGDGCSFVVFTVVLAL